MYDVSDEIFEELVEQAVADIPARFADHLDNVAFRVDDTPSQAQLAASGALHHNTTLLGLYQGVPLPKRSAGYSGMVPDVITVFKQPHLRMVSDLEHLRAAVHETVWHEVAHYFGLDHGQIRALQD